jgi:N-acetylmuramoyl-L-alanine amidase
LHSLDVKKNLEPLSRGYVTAGQTNRSIVIDPGHGGINAGTHSVDGRWEKEFTLDWALRLAPLLAQKGWKVFLTRTNDVDVSLADRVLFAELCHADLFLSLHFNSGGGSAEASGLETFCLTPTGMASTLTRDFSEDPRQVFPNNAFDEQNVQLAAQVQRALIAIGDSDRGVRRARFLTVLRGQRRPAALIEGGFLSNPREARRIADPAHRQRMAEAVANALDPFLAAEPVLVAKAPVTLVENREPEKPAVIAEPEALFTNSAPVEIKPVKRRVLTSPRNR